MRIIFFLLGFFGTMTGTFFGSAGRWDLPLAWVCLVVYAVFMVLTLFLMDPELRRERMNPAPGGIDRHIRLAMLPFMLACCRGSGESFHTVSSSGPDKLLLHMEQKFVQSLQACRSALQFMRSIPFAL